MYGSMNVVWSKAPDSDDIVLVFGAEVEVWLDYQKVVPVWQILRAPSTN